MFTVSTGQVRALFAAALKQERTAFRLMHEKRDSVDYRIARERCDTYLNAIDLLGLGEAFARFVIEEGQGEGTQAGLLGGSETDMDTGRS